MLFMTNKHNRRVNQKYDVYDIYIYDVTKVKWCLERERAMSRLVSLLSAAS